MTREEAKEYANNMTYRDAINNLMKARSIPYRKATFIKVNELLKALEQEPSGDLIRRDDVFNALDRWYSEEGEVVGIYTMIENISSVKPQPCEDAISRQAAIKAIDEKAKRIKNADTLNGLAGAVGILFDLPSVIPQQRIGHCEDCKHFHKLPYHADTLGKCIHHGGFCPKGDWYCADFEPQERSE